jgi:hypothetical protein
MRPKKSFWRKTDFVETLPFFHAKNLLLHEKMAKSLQNLFFGNNFFWVHFVSEVSLQRNQRKNTDLFTPILAYFERKNF